jgi:phosphotransferase system enzyme I (PtsP)
VVEDGSAQSHVAIVAKALGIAAVGQAGGVVERVGAGDAAIVDAITGEVHLRPSSDVVAAYSDKVRFLARRQRQYKALKDVPAVTADGERVELHMNAGLLVDMPHLKESGADGVGLFRTELLFMLSSTLPKLERQVESYRAIVARAGDKPVIFRTLDIGGDKVLHYLRQPKEENPAMGWRAIRMGLDRPALLRTQVRALLRGAAGHELRLMIPMISAAQEMDDVRAIVEKERAIVAAKGYEAPKRVAVGAMIEVPCLLFELDALMKKGISSRSAATT